MRGGTSLLLTYCAHSPFIVVLSRTGPDSAMISLPSHPFGKESRVIGLHWLKLSPPENVMPLSTT